MESKKSANCINRDILSQGPLPRPKRRSNIRMEGFRGRQRQETTEMEPGHAQRFYVRFRSEIRGPPVLRGRARDLSPDGPLSGSGGLSTCREMLQQRGPEGGTTRRIGNGLASYLDGLLKMY